MILTAKMRRQRLPLKFASIWLALVTALLSSLMFGGVPRTTALGSAFNPATTAVALQPSRAQPRIVAEVHEVSLSFHLTYIFLGCMHCL